MVLVNNNTNMITENQTPLPLDEPKLLFKGNLGLPQGFHKEALRGPMATVSIQDADRLIPIDTFESDGKIYHTVIEFSLVPDKEEGYKHEDGSDERFEPLAFVLRSGDELFLATKDGKPQPLNMGSGENPKPKGVFVKVGDYNGLYVEDVRHLKSHKLSFHRAKSDPSGEESNVLNRDTIGIRFNYGDYSDPQTIVDEMPVTNSETPAKQRFNRIKKLAVTVGRAFLAAADISQPKR